ncbi:MAG TPA: integrase core domain-containing protein [Candidatus Dormibacteraeota bacterium]|nr:integrase core domain-containing protein [Candidatus Dormibacteraeota bacterium]
MGHAARTQPHLGADGARPAAALPDPRSRRQVRSRLRLRARGRGAEVRRIPPRSPQANSIAERWVASARREALDWLLVLNERHLRCILKEYVEHYNRARPHRSLHLRPPTGDPTLGDRDAQVMVTTRLGGLLREYSRAAA